MASVTLPAWFTNGPRQKGPARLFLQTPSWSCLLSCLPGYGFVSGWPVLVVADAGCPPISPSEAAGSTASVSTHWEQDRCLTWSALDPQPLGGAQGLLDQWFSKCGPSITWALVKNADSQPTQSS